MPADFALKRSPEFRVASFSGKVPWTETALRSAFRVLVKWAKSRHLQTGKWFIVTRGRDRWEACLELRRPARGEGRIHVTTLPATMVATITFDPKAVSPRVIYHGMMDWLRWRRKTHEIKSVGYTREQYIDDPWSNPKAWARATVEYTVRK